jgi:hypothetical protein
MRSVPMPHKHSVVRCVLFRQFEAGWFNSKTAAESGSQGRQQPLDTKSKNATPLEAATKQQRP